MNRRRLLSLLSLTPLGVLAGCASPPPCPPGTTWRLGSCIGPATDTPQASATATETRVPAPTATATRTATARPSATATRTPAATSTATPKPTSTSTPQPTATAPVPPSGWVDLGVVPQVASSPTALGRIVAQLHPFAGEIFIGYGDWNDTKQPGCDVIAWDGQRFATYGHLATDATWSLRRVGDDLWVLVTDPEVGSDPDAMIVRPDHSSRLLSGGTSPYPWHLFDVVSWNGHTYIAGSDRSTPSDAATVWMDRPRTNGSGVVDWPKVYQYPNTIRAYGVFVLNDRMYVSLGNGQSAMTVDGLTWTAGPTLSTSVMHKPLITGGAAVYRTWWPAMTASPLYGFDGSDVRRIVTDCRDHCLDDAGNLVILLNDGRVLDADKRVIGQAPVGAISIAMLDGAIYVGTVESHLFRFGV